MPPMIVAPDRDVPGMSANACAMPTFSASGQRIASTSSMRTVDGDTRCRRSAHRMTSAPATNASATGTGANRWRLMSFANSRPSTAAGRNATTRFSTKRCAARSRASPASAVASRTRYSQHTARIAPAWITISNTLARSPV